MVKLGFDVMGSDTSPLEIFSAIQQVMEHLEGQDRLVVFATPSFADALSSFLSFPLPNNLEFCLAEEEISMRDEPVWAVRRKSKSSLVLGILGLQRGDIDAFVSTGNTGALTVASAIYLKRFKGLERPALLAEIPSSSGITVILDVGASVHSRVPHLVQFAHLGSAYQKAAGNRRPRVALLNMGTEAAKGSLLLREVYRLLQEGANVWPFEFIGNVEGHEAFKGVTDVLVTEGLIGNVFLKTAEGIYALLKEQCKENPIRLPVRPAAGAMLCGVKGLVLKCHGASSSSILVGALLRAHQEVKKGTVTAIEQYYASSM